MAIVTSQPRCRVQMLGSLCADPFGHVLKQLQLVDILAVFALACTARDMHALVWKWLLGQSVLQVDELHGSRNAIFRMVQMVRARLSDLGRFYVGQSFFCFDGERGDWAGGGDTFVHLGEYDEKGAVQDHSLAQLVLPFFLVTSQWLYYFSGATGYRTESQRLQYVDADGLDLGDIGAASTVFALRNLDASAVNRLEFASCGLTNVGARELAGLLGELPALTRVNLASNDLTAEGKRAITRACRRRLSSGMPAVYVRFEW